MKIKHLLMASVALIAGMASCSKDAGNGVNGEEIDFYLQVTRTEGTRADAGQIGTVEVSFNEGALFFAKDNGDVVRYIRITDGFGSGVVKPSELEDGYLFTGISNQATKVHIVGNVDFGDVISFGNLSQLENDPIYTLSLFDMVDDDYGVSKATLYGEDELKVVTPSAANKMANRAAKVKLAPILSRLEIVKIGTTDSDIDDDFVLEGIYIDNFFYSSTVLGSVSDYNTIPYVEKTSYLEYTRATGYADTEWYPILFDDDQGSGNGLAASSGAPYTVAPDNGAWAYNFYPSAQQVPYIILHLSNVTVNGDLRPNEILDGPGADSNGAHAGEAYLTVTGYNNADGSVNLTGGYAYVIKNLFFDADDLRDEPKGPENPGEPGDDKYDVFVEVELINWKSEDVEVEFN